jgi:hypothetical protein
MQTIDWYYGYIQTYRRLTEGKTKGSDGEERANIGQIPSIKSIINTETPPHITTNLQVNCDEISTLKELLEPT